MRMKTPFMEIGQQVLGNVSSMNHEGNISDRNCLVFDQVITNYLNSVRNNGFA